MGKAMRDYERFVYEGTNLIAPAVVVRAHDDADAISKAEVTRGKFKAELRENGRRVADFPVPCQSRADG